MATITQTAGAATNPSDGNFPTLVEADPGIFTLAWDGTAQGAIVNQDGSPVGRMDGTIGGRSLPGRGDHPCPDYGNSVPVTVTMGTYPSRAVTMAIQ